MIIGLIRGANFTYLAPDGMDNCSNLHVRVDDLADGSRMITSAWMPTPDELALLNQGQPIHLHIYGSGHPVVAMTVPED